MSARNADQTAIARIEEAFWTLYEKTEGCLITMADVVSKSGLSPEIVSASFPTPDSILRSIEDRQIDLLEDLFKNTPRVRDKFSSIFRIFQAFYDRNERYLAPLVIDRRDNAFAVEYRAVLEDKLFQDLEVLMTRKDAHAVEMLEFSLRGFVELLLMAVSSHNLTDRDVDVLSDAIMRYGYEKELRDEYGIVLGVMSKDE